MTPTVHPNAFAMFWRVGVRPHRRAAATILAVMAVSSLMDALTVGLTVPLLDALVGQGRTAQPAIAFVQGWWRRLGIEPAYAHVVLTLLAVAGAVFVIRAGLALWSQYRTVAVAVTLRRTTRVALLDRFLRARYDELTQRSRGAIVTEIAVPAEAVCGGMIDLGRFALHALTVVSMGAVLLTLSWPCTLAVGALALGMLGLWRRYAEGRSVEQGQRLFSLREQQGALLVDALDGVKVIKAHGLEPTVAGRYDALMREELAPELRFMLLRDAPTLVHEALAVLIVLGLGAVMVAVPALGLRLSLLAAFLIAIRRIAPAVAGMAMVSANLHRDLQQLQLIDEVIGRLPQERRGGGAVGPIERVELRGVGFAYPSRPERPALRDVDLALQRGTMTAVVGPTGAGKSTIAALVMGWHEPDRGRILVNGRDRTELDLAAWRARLGVVAQDVFVFHASIRENIRLWDAGISEAQVRWAAEVSQLAPVIAALPEGDDTIVGDRGVRLSGGQCQRLALARALARRPELLILDEATSALDTVTERAVHEAIRAVQTDAAVLVIAHRLSTIRDADEIVVLDGGRVVERGTHEALRGAGGLYSKLYAETGAPSVPAVDAAEAAAPA